jgi:hypothetical protein
MGKRQISGWHGKFMLEFRAPFFLICIAEEGSG